MEEIDKTDIKEGAKRTATMDNKDGQWTLQKESKEKDNKKTKKECKGTESANGYVRLHQGP